MTTATNNKFNVSKRFKVMAMSYSGTISLPKKDPGEYDHRIEDDSIFEEYGYATTEEAEHAIYTDENGFGTDNLIIVPIYVRSPL